MKQLLIKGGRIIDPTQGIDETGSLLVSGDRISWLGKGGTTPPRQGYDVLHAEGLIVCPGFVDFHCHLRQPGFEQKETIASGTQAAARGGFTTICCMPNTNPPLDSREMIDYVKSIASKEGAVRVLPLGCVTKGRKGEELVDMEELAGAGVVAYSDDGAPVGDSNLMRQALERSRAIGLPISNHCEDTALAEGGLINEGAIARRLGLRGWPAAAEENMIARDIALAGETSGYLHIDHVTTSGGVELIRRGKEKGIRFTAEATPHHLTLTEDMVVDWGTLAKVNPPLRTKKDIEALFQGLKENVIDIIVSDHAPHAEADKRCDFAKAGFGISVFETALGSLMGLVHSGHIPLTTLIAKLTSGPAKLIKEEKLGTLEPGTSADIVIFDPDKEWTVDPAQFASRGKNTPLAGSVLRGKVMATIFQGKLAYKDDSIKIEAG